LFPPPHDFERRALPEDLVSGGVDAPDIQTIDEQVIAALRNPTTSFAEGPLVMRS
jgi:hypothetical protein